MLISEFGADRSTSNLDYFTGGGGGGLLKCYQKLLTEFKEKKKEKYKYCPKQTSIMPNLHHTKLLNKLLHGFS